MANESRKGYSSAIITGKDGSICFEAVAFSGNEWNEEPIDCNEFSGFSIVSLFDNRVNA